MSRSAAKPSLLNRTTILYATLAIVVLAIIIGVGLASRNVVPENATKAVGESKLKVGDTAPDFTVQTNAGPFQLSQINEPVLLELFATWCPHCQFETTILNDLYTKDQGKLAIVAVSADPFDINHQGPETQADVNSFGQRFNVRYPIAFDPNLTVASLYLKGGYPTMVLIDPGKKIRWINSGQVDQKTLEKAIKPVLSPAS